MGRWVYAEHGRCAECNEPLKDDGRADQRYCGSTCRQRAHRSLRPRLADDVKAMLSETFWSDQEDSARIPGRDPALAASAFNEVMAGTLELANYPGPRWRAHAEQIRNRRPDLWAEFGQSVILAAARKVSIGTCRWCLALMNASMWDEKITPDAATRKLLSNPCDKCSALIASVTTTSGPGTRPGATTPAVDADLARNTPKAGMLHATAACARCRVAQLAADKRKIRKHAHDDELAAMALLGREPHAALPGRRVLDLYQTFSAGWQPRYASQR
jgi:hypothetical protein